MFKKLFISAVVLLCAAGLGAAQEATGKLKGKVADEKGKPLAGAEVRVNSPRTRLTKEATTDASGVFQFDLPPDHYVVSVEAEGYQGGTLKEMMQVEAGQETGVKTIKLGKAKRTSLVRGAVFDVEGRSLGGVRLKLVRIPTEEEEKANRRPDSLTREYLTNSRGEFAFRLPSTRARYQVTATLSGYKAQTRTVDVNPDESVPLSFELEPVKD